MLEHLRLPSVVEGIRYVHQPRIVGVTMKLCGKVSLLLMALLLMVATTAWGAPFIRLIGQEPVYQLWGEDLQGVGALDITVGYDTAGLKNPRVSQQELSNGSILLPYLTTPGAVRVVLLAPDIKGITGSGSIAQISFDSLSGSSGKIVSLTVKAVSAGSRSELPVQTMIAVSPAAEVKDPTIVSKPSTPAINLTDGGTPSGATAGATAPEAGKGETGQKSAAVSNLIAALTGQSTGSSASSVPTSTAVVTSVNVDGTMGNPSRVDENKQPVAEVSDGAPRVDDALSAGNPVAENAPDAGQSPTEVALPGETRTHGKAKSVALSTEKAGVGNAKSVLTLFREYKGPRTPAALTALFAKGSVPGVTQNPAIAIADGVSPVTLTVESDSSSSPNFSISGGKMVSLKRDGSRYRLTIIPKVGAMEVTVSLLQQESITTIPLVVVLPLDLKKLPSGRLDEATFVLLLKNNGSASGSAHPESLDGYQNDYLYTAHFLLQKTRK
jgi:hypothetical protein